jgi:aminocarboxymuconate-semialdehyde decarboxylase
MTTRRNFLKGGSAAVATGIMFCGCGLLQSAHGQGASRQKLPVAVNGKRVKTIDIHAHCLFREASKPLGDMPPSPVRGADEAVIEIDKRLAAMDAQAVDMEVLSINPNWYSRDRELAGQVVKIQNEKLAELCASKPDRFAGFASLTLQAPDLAVQELETAVKKQGLKGAAIGGVVAGVAFSDPKFHPSGPRRKSSTCPCSSIRRASPNSTSNWPATAGSATASPIRWRRRSRSRT